jgi:hypothetical protein
MLIRSKHAFALVLLTSISAAAVPRALHPDIEIRKVGDFSRAVRIAQDPRDQQLYVMDQRAGIAVSIRRPGKSRFSIRRPITMSAVPSGALPSARTEPCTSPTI